MAFASRATSGRGIRDPTAIALWGTRYQPVVAVVARDLGTPTAASVAAATTLVTANALLGATSSASVTTATATITAPALLTATAASVTAASTLATAPTKLGAVTAGSVTSAAATITAKAPITATAASVTQATATVTTSTPAVRQLGNITVTTAAILRPAAQTHARQLGTTTVFGRDLQPAGIAHTRRQGNPTLSARALPSGIAHNRALGAPSVNPIHITGLSRTSPSGYDATILSDTPSLYINQATATDASGNGHTVTAVGSPASSTAPNGDACYAFDNRISAVSSLLASNASGPTVTTGTIAPVANSTLVLWIAQAFAGGTTVTSVTGLGLTWTLAQTLTVSASTKLDCWTAVVGATPGTGAITITLAAAASVCYDINQVVGGDPTTPLVATNTKTATGSGTTSTITFNTPAAGGLLLYGCALNSFFTQTPRTGWAELSDQARSGPSVSLATQVSPATPGTTGSSTFTSAGWGAIGIELKVAPAGAFVLTTPQYLEIADANDLSATNTGTITIEAWIRPDTLSFAQWESTGYVHWLGKGDFADPLGPPFARLEYAARMYNLTNTETPPRPNRISGYAFNKLGGLGIGSFFQDAVTVGEWIHYALIINTTTSAGSDVNGFPYDLGYAKIYKNGVLRDQDALDQAPTLTVTQTNTTAPFRIATLDALSSFFQGAIAKPAVYGYELTVTQILAHYAAMTGARQLGTPAATTVTILRPAHQTHTRTLGNPTAHGHLTLGPPSLNHARAQGSITVIAPIMPAGLQHARTVQPPHVNTRTLAPAALNRA